VPIAEEEAVIVWEPAKKLQLLTFISSVRLSKNPSGSSQRNSGSEKSLGFWVAVSEGKSVVSNSFFSKSTKAKAR
jgi:hypothetical protein